MVINKPMSVSHNGTMRDPGMDFTRLRHAAWTGVVLPLALAVVATFSPDLVRGGLLIAAIITATLTFFNTEFAARRIWPTLIACGVFAALANAVFIAGHVLDARAKTAEHARNVPPGQAPSLPKPATPKVDPPNAAMPESAKVERKKLVAKPKPGATYTPTGVSRGTSVGSVTVQPGAVASFGQQGGQTAGTIINQAPLPAIAITEIEGNRHDDDSYVTRLNIAITGAIVPTFGIRVSAPSMTSMEMGAHAGLLMQSVSELKNGSKTHTLSNVMGNYEVILRSSQPEHFSVEYGCVPITCK